MAVGLVEGTLPPPPPPTATTTTATTTEPVFVCSSLCEECPLEVELLRVGSDWLRIQSSLGLHDLDSRLPSGQYDSKSVRQSVSHLLS